MSKYAQGVYKIQHPEKYVGKGIPKYRSSWELFFFVFVTTMKKLYNGPVKV